MAQQPKKPADEKDEPAKNETEAATAARAAEADGTIDEQPTPTQEELNEHKRRLAEGGNYYNTRESKAD